MSSAQPNKKKYGKSFQYDQANQPDWNNQLRAPKSFKRSAPQGNNAFHTLFEQAANRLGVSTELKAIRICHAASQQIADQLPSHHQEIEVISYNNGTLNLRAASSVLRQRLFTKKHLLESQLNELFGPTTIKKISIRS